MIKKVLLSLAYSNLWIALSAGAQVWVHYQIFGVSPRLEPCLLAVASMFWVYTFAKAVHFDPTADALNDPDRTRFLKSYRIPLIVWAASGLVVGGYLSARNSATTLVLFLLPTLAGLLYDLKFLPAGFRYRRLKDITGVKGLVVAGAWVALTLGLPLQYGAAPEPGTVAAVGLWSFLHWLINTTYFDLGDIEGDRAENTQTVPVRFGYSTTRRVLHLLNLVTVVLFYGLWTNEAVATAALPAGLAALNNLYILTKAGGEQSDISFECDVIADGLFIWVALYLLIL